MAVYVRPTEKQAQEMAAAYVQGDTLQVIAEKFGFSVPTVSKYVKSTGVTVASKGRRSKTISNARVTATVLPVEEEKLEEVVETVDDSEESTLFDF